MNRGQRRAAWAARHRAEREPAPPRVSVFVERLSVVGLGALAPEMLGSVVQSELARLLREPASPHWELRGQALAHVDGGAFKAPRLGSTEAVGQHVARAIAGGLRS